MAESREDGEDNLSEFDQQLRTLNMDRAEMLAIAHKTKKKEAIAKYLSDKPRNFEALAKFSSVEAALHEVIYHDPIIGIRAIIAQCKKDGMPRKIADIFERLFLEEVYNKSWNPNLADPYTSENFHALVAKLRGIAIFFSMNDDFFRVFKRRFMLALAKCGALNKMEIPEAFTTGFSDVENREIAKALAESAQQEQEFNSSDRTLERYVQSNQINAGALYLNPQLREEIVRIMSDKNVITPGQEKIPGETLNSHEDERNANKNELFRLLTSYPDPSVIIDHLLTGPSE